ncbi:MAG: hypothetical protein FIB06_08430 [Betaproteobacteria bacterium]|nr:hypothetical protein [Betaproteobacteria bacterium]
MVAQVPDHLFPYTEQILFALVPVGATVVCHGLGMSLVRRCYRRFAPPLLLRDDNNPARSAFMIMIVALMLITHFAEVIVWAVFYRAMGLLESAQDAMYYSMEYYTTLAISVHKLPGTWSGFGGFESMTAMLMFGWSTAVLAAVVQKMHSIDT